MSGNPTPKKQYNVSKNRFDGLNLMTQSDENVDMEESKMDAEGNIVLPPKTPTRAKSKSSKKASLRADLVMLDE